MGIPKNGWFKMQRPKITWMIWWYPYFRKPHIFSHIEPTITGSAPPGGGPGGPDTPKPIG